MSEPYIVCLVGGVSYAIPARDVQQLELLETITRVPSCPDFLDGVIYVRGQVVPVINLRQRFGLERIPYDVSARLVIVRFDGRVVGLAVDSAREFLSFASDALQPPPESLLGYESDVLAGVISTQERLILVLDLTRLLHAEQPAKIQPKSTKE